MPHACHAWCCHVFVIISVTWPLMMFFNDGHDVSNLFSHSCYYILLSDDLPSCCHITCHNVVTWHVMMLSHDQSQCCHMACHDVVTDLSQCCHMACHNVAMMLSHGLSWCHMTSHNVVTWPVMILLACHNVVIWLVMMLSHGLSWCHMTCLSHGWNLYNFWHVTSNLETICGGGKCQ